MIAKVPSRRNDGRSSFTTLAHYLTGEKLDLETGEVVRAQQDIYIETNCLSSKTAPAEMKAVADMNARVHDPVYHLLISWREGEQPTNEQMVNAAMKAMEAVGMARHQYVLAVHRETDNHHIHLMVNRVHPETLKAVYPKRDFFKLDHCMREMEIEHGWQHDRGPFAVVDGKIVKTPKATEPQPPKPTKVKDMEAATGCQSLLTYAQSISDDLVTSLDAGDWQTLHVALRKHGLEIREAGQGFKIHDLADPSTTPVKASDVAAALGGGKLKKHLGEFQKPLRIVQAGKPERTYNPYREKRQAGRDERREARAAARLDLRRRFDQEKRERLARQQELRAAEQYALREVAMRARAERERIRAVPMTPEMRKAQLSVMAMTAAAEREQIKLNSREAREAGRVKGYRTWCTEQAERGDSTALAQLKGWQYQESRRRRAAEREEEAAAARAAIRAAEDEHDTPARPAAVLDEVSWQVDRRTGDVTYRLRGREALRDTGRQVAVLQPTDDESIEAGLRLASQKFGPQLTLTGSEEFQRRCVEVAVAKELGLRFADPAADAYRQELDRKARQFINQENQHGKSQIAQSCQQWDRKDRRGQDKGR